MSEEIKQALAYHRRVLKARLWRERSEKTTARSRQMEFRVKRPVCPYCGGPIYNMHEAVMHEWLIRRAALPVKHQIPIMHELNCVLVHNSCHAQFETTGLFKLRCALAQYERYSREDIEEWVQGLDLKFVVDIPWETEAYSVHL